MGKENGESQRRQALKKNTCLLGLSVKILMTQEHVHCQEGTPMLASHLRPEARREVLEESVSMSRPTVYASWLPQTTPWHLSSSTMGQCSYVSTAEKRNV